MKILILGTCTSSKANVKQPTPAAEVYQGVQHQYILQAQDLLKEATNDTIDYYIISAKYGLIKSTEKIKPYDRTFVGKTNDEVEKMSEKMGIDEDLIKLLSKYDIVFWTLSDAYMNAIPTTLEDIEKISDKGTTNIFFIPKSFLDDYPTIEDEDYIVLKDSDTKKYGAGKVMLKGKYMLLLADIISHKPNPHKELEHIKRDPEYIEKLIKENYKESKKRLSESLNISTLDWNSYYIIWF